MSQSLLELAKTRSTTTTATLYPICQE